TGAIPAMITFPFVGEAAQRFGRGKVIGTLGLLNVVIATPLFALAVAQKNDVLVFWVSGAVVLYVSLLILAVITPFIIDMILLQVRSLDYCSAYSFSIILSAFYTYYMLWLCGLWDNDYTPLVSSILGGICLVMCELASRVLLHVSME